MKGKITLTFEQLSRYYQSPYWNRVRLALKEDRGYACQRCRSTRILQAHHLTYEHLCHELSHLSDLELLCKECHDEQTMRDRAERPVRRNARSFLYQIGMLDAPVPRRTRKPRSGYRSLRESRYS